MRLLKILSVVCLSFFLYTFSYAQSLSIEVPVKEEVRVGQEFIAKLQPKGLKQYKIKMKDNPASAFIQHNRFIWTPLKSEKRYYVITFELLDSAEKIVDEQFLALTVSHQSLPPELIFDKALGDTIQVTENKEFTFAARLKSNQATDARLLIPYFTFNENPNLRQFDNSKISIVGDQLLFVWTPSNREALEEYVKFRITLVDVDKSMADYVFNFKVKNINQPPYFVNEPLDTVYQNEGQELVIDFTAIDPDNDKLEYDYTPSNPKYSFNGNKLVVQADNTHFPLLVNIRVSDGKNILKHQVCILKNAKFQNRNNTGQEAVIGDLTRKTFSEGDSIETYLNILNGYDLSQMDLAYSDLNISPGIEKLSPYLIFDKKGTYIKVRSKGLIPYSLVDRDYTYNIVFRMTAADGNVYTKILVLTMLNKADPFSVSRQRDSLAILVNNYIQNESIYKGTLQKVYTRISKPWWRKVAVITGTVSGVIGLVQANNYNKSLGIVSAGISLGAIMVSNIPTLSEKKLAWINSKITDSNSRLDIIQKKREEFYSAFLFDINQAIFDLKRAEIKDLIRQDIEQRTQDICTLLADKKTNRKIHTLLRQKGHDKKLEEIFICPANISVFKVMHEKHG